MTAKPIPPPSRIIREGGGTRRCEICHSSVKRRWFGLGRIVGCIQPRCWNYYGYKDLPAGVNPPPDLYGGPVKGSPPPSPPPRILGART